MELEAKNVTTEVKLEFIEKGATGNLVEPKIVVKLTMNAVGNPIHVQINGFSNQLNLDMRDFEELKQVIKIIADKLKV